MRSRTWVERKNAVKAVAGRKRRRRRRPSPATRSALVPPEALHSHIIRAPLWSAAERRRRRSYCPRIRRTTWSSVFLLFLTLSAGVPSCVSRQEIVEHPSNVSVRVGDTAVLRCRVENQKGTLQWVKNGFGLGTTRELPLFERYSMVGKLNLGEYHLQVRNVTVDDDDEYECQLSPTDNEPIRISSVARLAVLAEPKAPELVGIHPPITSAAQSQSNQIVIDAVESSELRLACRVARGRPAARVRWAVTADADGRNVVEYLSSGNASQVAANSAHREGAEPNAGRARVVDEMKEEPDGRFTITSNLTFLPSKAENGKYLACLATHDTYGAGETASLRAVAVRLDVSYAPKVRVEVDAAESRVLEGGRVVLRCHADARPHRDMTVRWSWSSPASTEPQRDEKRLTLLDQQRAMISDLKLRDNNARVTCAATNAIGTESASIRLDIPYGPRFTSTNQTRLIRRGDTTTFECDVVGNPTPDVRWYHNDDAQPVAAGANLTIVDASEWDAGTYRCVATVVGFPLRSLTHRLRLKTAPDVRLRSELVERGGNDAMIVCEIRSHMLPFKVLWTFNGRPIADSDVSGQATSNQSGGDGSTAGRNGRFRLVTAAAADDDGDADGRWESRLLVRHFTPTDHGLYNCTAHNELGVAHDARRVWRRTLWERVADLIGGVPFTYRLGAFLVALCLLIMFLFVCCVCYHRNQHNAAKVASTTTSSSGGGGKRCCCCCCFGGGTSNNSNYSQDGGDVIVKCEALDGAQFYPELYGSPHMDHSDIVYTKDYISVPQNNPDLDYLPPSASSNYGAMYGGAMSEANGAPSYDVYGNGYGASMNSNNNNNNYGSSVTTPVSFADCYGQQPLSGGGGGSIYGHYGGALNDYVVGNPSVTLGGGGGRMLNGGPSPLETLTEVITPDTEGGGALGSNDALLPAYEPTSMNGGVNRPMSRISTHV